MNEKQRLKLKQEILTALRYGPLHINDVLAQCPEARNHSKADVKLVVLSLKDEGAVVSKRHFNKHGQRWVFILAGGALA